MSNPIKLVNKASVAFRATPDGSGGLSFEYSIPGESTTWASIPSGYVILDDVDPAAIGYDHVSLQFQDAGGLALHVVSDGSTWDRTPAGAPTMSAKNVTIPAQRHDIVAVTAAVTALDANGAPVGTSAQVILIKRRPPF